MLLNETLIMIVDDNPQNIKVLASVLQDIGYELMICMNGHEALEALTVEKPDLILLDVMMPDMDGYEVCQKIKNDPDLAEIPIIFLTAKVDIEDIVKGFEVGGSDYVLKPFHEMELRVRIRNQLELKWSRDTLTAKNEELSNLIVELTRVSTTDPLTSLYNRRFMTDQMVEEVARYERHRRPFTLIMADIDHFKKVNDTYGHGVGDTVLKTISGIMTTTLRTEDVLARWGGEEFLFLLPETQIEGAIILADRIRREIEAYVFEAEGSSFSVTMTFGIAQHIDNQHLDKTIQQADQALFEGKAAGRNRVTLFKG